jgi:hypothetical protein
MRASSAPPGACSARSRAPHALSSRFCARFSARFSERQTRAIFRPKNINNKQTTLNQSGSISGNLVNKNQAIEFASVTLASIQDSNKVLFYEATDTLGKFSFLNLSLGEYILKN